MRSARSDVRCPQRPSVFWPRWRGARKLPKSGPAGTEPPANAAGLILTNSTYDVALKPDTRLIDADTMSRAYRGTGSDGTLTFDAAKAPALAAIPPGTTVIFAGTALLKVQSIHRSGSATSPFRSISHLPWDRFLSR